MPSIYPTQAYTVKSDGPHKGEAGGEASASKWESLFITKDSKDAAADTTAQIAELKQLAGGNDPDAIELLINLAAGISGTDVASQAVNALLDVYGQADGATTESIERQCLALFEMRERATQFQPKDGKAGGGFVANAKLPVAVLYLAGSRGVAALGASTYSKIATELAEEMGAENRIWLRRDRDPNAAADDGHDSLGAQLMSDRFVNQSELVMATRRHEDAPVHVAALSFNDTPEQFAQVLGTVISNLELGARASPGVQAVFVNTGGHWVTLALCRNDATKKIDAIVFDSIARERGIEAKLREQLGERLGEFKLLGKDFQTGVPGVKDSGLPDACGPFALLAARRVNEIARRATDHASVRTGLDAWVAEVERRHHDGQVALVKAERARMLANVSANRSRQ